MIICKTENFFNHLAKLPGDIKKVYGKQEAIFKVNWLDSRLHSKRIKELIEKFDKKVYVISSQNRFAIKVARANSVPCAFLDGLSWFWKKIPDDHLIADIIFWINYPNITKKIPVKLTDKIFIIHGITEQVGKSIKKRRKGETLMYIGGCNNPLTDHPTHYLDLLTELIIFIKRKGINMELSTDLNSKTYLKKYSEVFNIIKIYDHSSFINKLSITGKFITNGGQTAFLEAAHVDTIISFFLPINLSQFSLINNLASIKMEFSGLRWENYIKLPKTFYQYSEKDAINFLNKQSLKIIKTPKILEKVCNDFYDLLVLSVHSGDQKKFSTIIGSSGAEDIFKIIKKSWGLK